MERHICGGAMVQKVYNRLGTYRTLQQFWVFLMECVAR